MPNDVLFVLGGRLRTARKGRNLTQERLAETPGLSARHIAKIEKGAVNPSFEALLTLVKTRGVSFDSIFDPADEQVEAEIQEIVGLYLSTLGIRVTSVGNYLIFYVVNHEDRRVDIARVLYGKRDWIRILTENDT